MQIELYPEFDEVFDNNLLKGIFYPLCKIIRINNEPLYFVSSNGIWTDGDIKNDTNQSSFTCFELKNGKYSFQGDTNVYIGYKDAQKIIQVLEKDFLENGEQYFAKKIKTDIYADNIIQNLNIKPYELDLEYYVKTFYEFSMNKLIYQKTETFGAFNHIIEDWGKPDKSPIVYTISDENFSGYGDIEINKDYLFPKSIEIEKYEKIGLIIGYEFFTDGNDSYLLLDKENNRVISINHYS